MKKVLRWSYGSKTYSAEAELSESPYYRKCQMERFLEFLPSIPPWTTL